MPITNNINATNTPSFTPIVAARSQITETGRAAVINLTQSTGNEPVVMFKQDPHRIDFAYAALKHEMQKDLPPDLHGAKLSHQGERLKNLVGVIYSEVKNGGSSDDIKKLDSICKTLVAAKGDENAEKAVHEKLSELTSLYGSKGFEKTINTFIEHCVQAWLDHHAAKSISVEKKEAFTTSQDVCKSVLHKLASDLLEPGLEWGTPAQKMNQFVDSCASISQTLTFFNAGPENPAPADPARNPNVPASADSGKNPDAQQLYIPAGSGPVTLQITNNSAGGSVGNINNSSGCTHGAHLGLSTADLKEILTSDLDKADKARLADKYLELNAGPRRFLNKIESVENPKPVPRDELLSPGARPADGNSPVNTLTLELNDNRIDGLPQTPSRLAVDEVDILIGNQHIHRSQTPGAENVVAKSTRPAQTQTPRGPAMEQEGIMTFTPGPGTFTGPAATNVEQIFTTERTLSLWNRKDPTPKHFVPMGLAAEFPRANSVPEPGRAGVPVLTAAAQVDGPRQPESLPEEEGGFVEPLVATEIRSALEGREVKRALLVRQTFPEPGLARRVIMGASPDDKPAVESNPARVNIENSAVANQPLRAGREALKAENHDGDVMRELREKLAQRTAAGTLQSANAVTDKAAESGRRAMNAGSEVEPHPARVNIENDREANRPLRTEKEDSTSVNHREVMRELNEKFARRAQAAEKFQPVKFSAGEAAESGRQTADKHVYTTVRTTSHWNRDAAPKHFVPMGVQDESRKIVKDAGLGSFGSEVKDSPEEIRTQGGKP